MPTLKGLTYGPIDGEFGRSQIFGPLGKLGPRDVALSPNQLRNYPINSYINAASNGRNFGTYRVADSSYISPGLPTKNTIELRNRDPGGPVSITRASNPYGFVPGGIDVFGDYPNPPGLSGLAARRLPQGVIQGGIDITGNSPASSYTNQVSNPTPGQGQYFQFLSDNAPEAAPPETSIGQNIPLNDQNVAPVTPTPTPLADTNIGKNIPLGDEFVSPGTQNDFYYSGDPSMNVRPPSAPAPPSAPPAASDWLTNATSGNGIDPNSNPQTGRRFFGNDPMQQQGATPWGWGPSYVDPRSANLFFGGLQNWNGPGAANPTGSEGTNPFLMSRANRGLTGNSLASAFGLLGRMNTRGGNGGSPVAGIGFRNV